MWICEQGECLILSPNHVLIVSCKIFARYSTWLYIELNIWRFSCEIHGDLHWNQEILDAVRKLLSEIGEIFVSHCKDFTKELVYSSSSCCRILS